MAEMLLPQTSVRVDHLGMSARIQKDRVDHLGMSPRMPTSPSMPRPASSTSSPRQQMSSSHFPPQKRPTTSRSQPELLSKLLFFVRHELQQLLSQPGTDEHIRERSISISIGSTPRPAFWRRLRCAAVSSARA